MGEIRRKESSGGSYIHVEYLKGGGEKRGIEKERKEIKKENGLTF